MKGGRFGVAQYVLLVAMVGVILLFVQNRAMDVEQHNQRVDLLLQLKQVEGELDRDVLLVTSFLLEQYDSLVKTTHRLHRLSGEIQSAELDVSGEGAERYRTELSGYLDTQQRKLALMERIKSKAALVRNGLHYLPAAAKQLHEEDERLGSEVSDVLAELLRYNLLSSDSGHWHIARRLNELARSTSVPVAARIAYDNVLFHMQANLRLTGELDQLRSAYTAIPGIERFDALYAAYTDLYAAQSRRAEIFSLVLLVLTVALIGGLGWAFRDIYRERRRAQRAWNQLRDAVESLSEAFALYAPDGRLVLHNRRYLDCYPWLSEQLGPNMLLSAVRSANKRAGVQVQYDSEKAEPVESELPGGQGRTYVEQLREGRWYLASDTRTSAGETVCVRVDISDSMRREQELRKLYRALEQSPASVVITNTEGNIEYVNPKFEESTGYTAEEAIGQNPRILKSGDKSPEEYKDMWETITAGKVWRGQFHNKRKDGAIYWEAASISPVRDGEGDITHFIAVKEDITARKRAEDQLRLNATVFDTTTEGIIVTDADGRIKTVNPAFTRITGYEAEEVVGKKPSLLSSGRHDEDFYTAMWHGIRTRGYWSGEIWNRRKDGSVFPEWLSLASIPNDRGEVQEYVAVFSDITRRKQDEEQIRRQANYDALTGLPNRSLLVDRLARSIAGARREDSMIALLFIDLDRFKGVNDTLGHVMGDELLQMVAERLQVCVREVDTVARFGGDEFVVILEDVKQANDAAEVAKKIIAELDSAFSLANREVFIGASIGITLFPTDTDDPSSMLRNADMAMYRAKDAGRNNYQFFTLTMNEQVQQRMALENDLRLALERDELALHYQPIVRFDSGELVGVEALLRWRHPQRGMVSPDTFIPLAEETGLIGPIGRWVLKTAVAQAAEWRRAGLHMRMSVNLSSRQLSLGLTVDEVADTLAENDLPAAALTLEITEGMMLEGAGEMLTWLKALKKLGVGLSVDDFGTGFSSLSYLKRFPMDTLKIDRSFVDGLPDDREDVSLVQAIVAMADSLDLKIVAEGVETERQRRFLQHLGCDLAQGYLFSKPLWAEAIPAFVSAQGTGPKAALMDGG